MSTHESIVHSFDGVVSALESTAKTAFDTAPTLPSTPSTSEWVLSMHSCNSLTSPVRHLTNLQVGDACGVCQDNRPSCQKLQNASSNSTKDHLTVKYANRTSTQPCGEFAERVVGWVLKYESMEMQSSAWLQGLSPSKREAVCFLVALRFCQPLVTSPTKRTNKQAC